MESLLPALPHQVAVPAKVQWRAMHFSQRLLPLSCVNVHRKPVASSSGPLAVATIASAASSVRSRVQALEQRSFTEPSASYAMVTASEVSDTRASMHARKPVQQALARLQTGVHVSKEQGSPERSAAGPTKRPVKCPVLAS